MVSHYHLHTKWCHVTRGSCFWFWKWLFPKCLFGVKLLKNLTPNLSTKYYTKNSSQYEILKYFSFRPTEGNIISTISSLFLFHNVCPVFCIRFRCSFFFLQFTLYLIFTSDFSRHTDMLLVFFKGIYTPGCPCVMPCCL